MANQKRIERTVALVENHQGLDAIALKGVGLRPGNSHNLKESESAGYLTYQNGGWYVVPQKDSDYAKRNATKRYKVTRWCCLGNCDQCCHLEFGNRIRVIQMMTDNDDVAKRCCYNFQSYGSILFERTKDGYAILQSYK